MCEQSCEFLRRQYAIVVGRIGLGCRALVVKVALAILGVRVYASLLGLQDFMASLGCGDDIGAGGVR